MPMSKILKISLIASTLGLIAAPFVVRQVRHQEHWRLCSEMGSYNFYFDKKLSSFDDGLAEDQFFPITPCSDNAKSCFTSYVSYKSFEQGGNRGIVEFNKSKIYFDKNGKLQKLVHNADGKRTVFRECKFPLFR